MQAIFEFDGDSVNPTNLSKTSKPSMTFTEKN